MINILFAAQNERWDIYEPLLREALAKRDLKFHLSQQIAPHEVDYIIYAPDSELQDFSPCTRCKAVLNLWAGVENIVKNPTLHIPLARMVDHGLTQGMVEWVCGHVLRHHLNIDHDIKNKAHQWQPHVPPLAQDRNVTILGFGALGRACAVALDHLGFAVSAWSNSPKQCENITLFHGSDELNDALSAAEILVLLLPSTPQTQHIINAQSLAKLPKGAVILNAARGPLIDDDALLASLDTGHVAHATLDVFTTEPLPQEHSYWHHPNVTVTPHIASATRPKTASLCIAQNIAGLENGEPLQHAVDIKRGY